MKSIRISIIGMALAASCVAARAEDESTPPTVAECHDLLTSTTELHTKGVEQLTKMSMMAYRCEAYPSQNATASRFLGLIAMELEVRFQHYLERHDEMHSFWVEDQQGKR